VNTSVLRVGIVGLSVSGGWASVAHVPALAHVDGVELRALATSSAATAEAAAEAYGLPLAFDSVEALAQHDEVDLVVVAVQVPRHRELVLPALACGKPVLCEWPLANGVAEAVELADAVGEGRGFVGLQGRSAPAVAYLRHLVADGFVGEVLSTSVIASGGAWGTPVTGRTRYLLDRTNGATLLTIVVGHLLDSVAHVLGEPVELVATTATRRKEVLNTDSGMCVPMTAEDQVAVAGVLEGGAVASFHVRGGVATTTNLLWEINGTEGDLQVTGVGGSLSGAVTIRGSRSGDLPTELAVPARFDRHPRLARTPAHAVAHAYDRIVGDLAAGTAEAPDFAHALRRHRMLDHIEGAAAEGTRHRLAP
jgi:predicted dehydrogenase